jgi:hypothetical protein
MVVMKFWPKPSYSSGMVIPSRPNSPTFPSKLLISPSSWASMLSATGKYFRFQEILAGFPDHALFLVKFFRDKHIRRIGFLDQEFTPGDDFFLMWLLSIGY